MYTIDKYELKIKDTTILTVESLEMISKGHVVICGEIGSGKSTFAKSLINFNEFSGKINYKGNNIKEFKITKYCNYIPQSLQYYFLMSSVIDEIKFATGADDNSIEEQLCEYRLSNKVYENPSSLSGGEQIRLAMLIARLNKVETIILDETVAMNDFQNLKKISEEVELMKQDCLVIEISHDLERISKADQILFIDNRSIVTFDTVKELLQNESASHLWSEND